MKYKFKEINKIEKIVDTVYVNDLSVLDDNSYVVNDVCVHNCGCLTTQQTGIGYPMASLIRSCAAEASMLIQPAKIVADGGFKKYSDIIKALALGADYVMLGSIFNKALESAGDNYVKISYGTDGYSYATVNSWRSQCENLIIPGNQNATLEELLAYGDLYKMFRGMSTKAVQRSLGNDKLKTSEGIMKYQQVEYTLAGWCENFESYLKSAMSYTDKTNLYAFIGEVTTIEITQNAFKRFNK